jgi:16S rRNA (adenine1518-N6/adenine1519-N6)-dimethyltransferase
MKVKPKKHLGQHFLKDKQIASDIVSLLSLHGGYTQVLEIGPGMGVLTDYLIARTEYETHLIDIDHESVVYLKKHYPELQNRIIQGDFLRLDLDTLFSKPFAIIGNFPYNISSQILFKVLDHKDKVTEIVCMLQKEVAQRLASPPGNKDYGILSVLLQAYYTIEYKFTVHEGVFDPPPKVKSGVIRLLRNGVTKLDCDEVLFKRIVKQGFNNRRKTLRNALKPLYLTESMQTHLLMDKRAEQLSVADFIELTKLAQGVNL